MRTSGAALVGVCIVAVAFGGCAGISPSSRRHVASARALAIQPDGKIVAAGTAGAGNRLAFALARYLPDGALDPAFGTGGTVTTRFPGSPPYSRGFVGAYARALGLQADGTLVAAGAASVGGSFGTGGTVTTDFGGVTGR